MDRSEPADGFDPEQRELCPDGACVGVIGSDGRCKECGALSPNPPSGVRDTPSEEVERHEAAGVTKRVDPGTSSVQGSESDEFDPEQRELCPDGACLGVVGSDGRCKICGVAGLGSTAPSP